jgi:hypothetical protein
MRSNSYIGWYNENEGRAYPIREDATRISTNGDMLPNDIVADLCISVPPEHGDAFIGSIRITPTIVSISVRSTLSGLLLGTFNRNSLQPFRTYALTPVISDVSGRVVFGTHRAVTTEDYRFTTAAQTGLEQRAVKLVETLPVHRLLRYGGNTATYADGLVRLVAGNGIEFDKDLVNNKIIVKLAVDSQSVFVSPCTTAACGVPPIRRIAGVCPDANGRITLRFE